MGNVAKNIGSFAGGGLAGLLLQNSGGARNFLSQIISGKPASQVGSASAYSPQQQQLMSSLTNFGMSNMSNLDIAQNPMYQSGASAIDEFLLPSQEDLENRYQTQFVEPQMLEFKRDIMPTIQQGYADIGGTRSSGLDLSLASAGQDLATKLASQRAALINEQQGRKQQAIGQAFQYGTAPAETTLRASQLGLQPSQMPIIDQGTPGILDKVLQALAILIQSRGAS